VDVAAVDQPQRTGADDCLASVLFTPAYVLLLGLQNAASAQTQVAIVHSAIGPGVMRTIPKNGAPQT
jgi:hypothetical protein